jgi:hypothetical protein
MIYKTLHRKPKIGHHEPHLRPGIIKYLLNDIGYMLKHVTYILFNNHILKLLLGIYIMTFYYNISCKGNRGRYEIRRETTILYVETCFCGEGRSPSENYGGMILYKLIP